MGEQKRECKKLLAQFHEMILWNANGAHIGNFLIMRLCNDNQLNIITYQNVLCFINNSNNFFIQRLQLIQQKLLTLFCIIIIEFYNLIMNTYLVCVITMLKVFCKLSFIYL